MLTQCSGDLFDFERVGSREIVARFDGGRVTSDGGGMLLREVDRRFGIIDRLACCFRDHRDPELVNHTVADLLRQRIFALCLGYEDLNDHDSLRHDPMLAVMVGKADPLGNERSGRDRGKALAGKSTLNRLELTPVGASKGDRYKKISADLQAIQDLLVEVYIAQHATAPSEIILDVDATDDPIHGHQLGRFFHGYYDSYCFLPLYLFSGDHPLLALLRPSNIDVPVGLIKHLERIVKKLRGVWPNVRIVLRGDSGFCRDYVMSWCEENSVDYILGLAKNKRLLRAIGKSMHEAQVQFEQTNAPTRIFSDLEYRTQKSWSRSRRVVAKAEHLAKGANPRFIVTSIDADSCDARTLYEDQYCARGEMENRIKEQQLCLFADRTSCHSLRANQLRLAFTTVSYVLMRALREHGLRDTSLSRARVDTIRLKLLKIGAVVHVTVRKVWVSLSESYPWQESFAKIWQNLTAWRKPAISSG